MLNRREAGKQLAGLAAGGVLGGRAGAAALAQGPVDATPTFIGELAKLRGQSNAVLRIPPGVHHFWPDRAFQKKQYVSNNDPFERAAFPIHDIDGLTVEGNGAQLIFHGVVTPFSVIGSQRVTLRDLEIDWERPFHCEARVLSSSRADNSIVLFIPAQFGYRISDENRFVFVGEGFERVDPFYILAFDPVKGETGYQALDNYFQTRTGKPSARYRAEAIAPNTVRLTAPDGWRDIPETGESIILIPKGRPSPAVFIEDSREILLDRVRIRHSGSMGVIAQTSENIRLTDCVVAPRANSGRLLSTIVDATHFVNCTGTVTLENSFFSGHMDDALNVHGIYLPVTKKIDPRTVEVIRSDFQQHGVKMLRPGDQVSLADAVDVDVYHLAKVEKVDHPDERSMLVTFEKPLPDRLSEGDVFNNLSRQAAVVMRKCTVTKNRARGILISTAAPVLIDTNIFHSPGSAIRISGGVDFWYESGPVGRVRIVRNSFENCKYGSWGDAVIDIVVVDGKASTSTRPYHDEVEIADNSFVTFDGYLVNAYRVGTLRFTGNTVSRSDAYPAFRKVDTPIVARDVGKLVVADNSVSGFHFPQLAKTS